MSSTLRLPEESVQKLQLFVSERFELTAQKQTKDDRQVNAAAGRISREVQRREVLANEGTPVRAVGQGPGYVDIDPDPGSGLVLRFTASPSGSFYVLSMVNGQPITRSIDIEGFQYEFRSAGPVYLRYKLGEDLKILTERRTLKGAKVDGRQGT